MAKRNDIVKAESQQLQPLENIKNLIHVIRDKQVMLDRDLARLYGVETRVLNQAVQRNSERFPEDFMFQLTKEEAELSRSLFATLNDSSDDLKSQIATSSESEILKSQNVTSSWGGVRKLPYAFTENGVAMLSSVLRSHQAINVNIQIMRAFTAMRHFLASNAQLFQRLEVMERTQLSLVAHQEFTDQKVEEIFRRLDEGGAKPTEGILFDGQIFDAYTFISDRIREANTRVILIDNYPNVKSNMNRATTIQQLQTMGRQILPKGSHLWLYGSRARGNNRANSDWDLIVLMDKDKQQLQDFDSYAYPFIEMGWRIGEEINPMLYTRKEWEQRHFTPFYHNVENDKVILI